MKKIVLFLMLCVVAISLCGCSSTYNSAITYNQKNPNEYFSVYKEWRDPRMGDCVILYANDTNVMYLCFDGDYTGGITPLYNADGTLQIYEGR